jgi:glucose uptake protein GlcU
MVWAVLAGAIWAVANTLTIVAVRDVGLAIAFPLWNINSLVGLFWGWLLFRELRGAGAKTWVSVLGGALAITIGAVALSYASAGSGTISAHRVFSGVSAALAAGLLLGTMYIPYRKAYLSGLNPLSFVTIFTFGELATIGLLALTVHDGGSSIFIQLKAIKSSVLWLFLGGFCWVIGDLFQQYGTKYVGISRAIPLSNTNQLWGLAWGANFLSFLHRC